MDIKSISVCASKMHCQHFAYRVLYSKAGGGGGTSAYLRVHVFVHGHCVMMMMIEKCLFLSI